MIALALLLSLAAPPPLACPAGAEPRGARPPEGYEEWCEGRDPLGRPWREGPARVYYDDGGVWVEEGYREGRRHGPFAERHRNGGTAREGAFAGGERVGRWTVRFESGELAESSEWRDGVPHGEFVSYWPNGVRRAEGRHCGGAQCGTWRTFDEKGKELGRVSYGEQSLSP